MAIPNPASGFARASNPAAEASSERLEQLRAILLRALDDLESQARQRPQGPALPPDDAEVERRLKQLEAAQAEFRAEVNRWENTKADQLQALDQDRRDLADVWQRIESLETQPRAQSPPQAAGTVAAARTGPRPHAVGPGSSLPPMPRPAATSTAAESPVTRAVLEQFQVLRRDVRRKADGRSSG